MSNVDLWRIKTGRKAAEDISDKACVQYGHDAEPLIRGLFALDYKDIYKVEYRGAFDMVRSAQHPFIFATLDGRLTETATGRLGVYEGKTTEILRSMQREKWRKMCIRDRTCSVRLRKKRLNLYTTIVSNSPRFASSSMRRNSVRLVLVRPDLARSMYARTTFKSFF